MLLKLKVFQEAVMSICVLILFVSEEVRVINLQWLESISINPDLDPLLLSWFGSHLFCLGLLKAC